MLAKAQIAVYPIQDIYSMWGNDHLGTFCIIFLFICWEIWKKRVVQSANWGQGVVDVADHPSRAAGSGLTPADGRAVDLKESGASPQHLPLSLSQYQDTGPAIIQTHPHRTQV